MSDPLTQEELDWLPSIRIDAHNPNVQTYAFTTTEVRRLLDIIDRLERVARSASPVDRAGLVDALRDSLRAGIEVVRTSTGRLAWMREAQRVLDEDAALRASPVDREDELGAAWEDGFRSAMDGEAWNATDERIAAGAANYVLATRFKDPSDAR